MKRRYIFPLVVVCIALGIVIRHVWPWFVSPISESVTIVIPRVDLDPNDSRRDYARRSVAIAEGLNKNCGADWYERFSVDQFHRLSQEWSAEIAKLASLKMGVRREAAVLVIDTVKGPRRFVDGYYLCLDTDAYHYRYQRYLSKAKAHILDATAYEDGETLLVFVDSGEIATGLYAFVSLSPSEIRIGSYQSAGIWEGGFAIGRIQGGSYRLEAKWLVPDVRNVRWLSDQSIAASICREECRDVTFTYADGKWADPTGFITDRDLAAQ